MSLSKIWQVGGDNRKRWGTTEVQLRGRIHRNTVDLVLPMVAPVSERLDWFCFWFCSGPTETWCLWVPDRCAAGQSSLHVACQHTSCPADANTAKDLLKCVCKAVLSHQKTHQLFGFRSYWFGAINGRLSSESLLFDCFYIISKNITKRNCCCSPVSWEDYQRHESIQDEHAEGRGAGFTFRHVGEGFVPDRQQRQQVEEERHEGSHQQTTPAETTTRVMLRWHATSKLATELSHVGG